MDGIKGDTSDPSIILSVQALIKSQNIVFSVVIFTFMSDVKG